MGLEEVELEIFNNINKYIKNIKKMLKISLFGLAAIVIFIFYALLTNA